jgi:DNA-binding response OmpR family regulator
MLSGLRVLVAEDEMLIAIVLEDMLDAEGCALVASVADVASGMAVDPASVDVAVLDVHLGREESFPLADRLRAAGVAVVFASGSTRESLPPRFAGCGLLEKPYTADTLRHALELARSAATV